MSLVSHTILAQSADTKQNIDKYKNYIKEIRGQSEPSNKSNGQKAIGTTENETSIETIRSIKEHIKLGKSDFWSLCPILLYQLAQPNSGCITTHELDDDHEHHHDHHDAIEADRKMGKTRTTTIKFLQNKTHTHQDFAWWLATIDKNT